MLTMIYDTKIELVLMICGKWDHGVRIGLR